MRRLAYLLPVCLTAAEDFEFFEKKVRPVLASRCYACHSTKAKPVQGDFYADSKDGVRRGGKSGVPAVIPGNPADSLLLKAIRGQHRDLKMPPGPPLPEDQIAAIEEWVKMGAPDPRTGAAPVPVPASSYDWTKEKQHWAYQPVKDSTAPASSDPAWDTTAIDRFIKARLDSNKLAPLPRASRQALIRRLTYDLTGLPPTPSQVRAFLADTSSQALAKAVDKLLESPQYGEHWGRHWLDLVRYADTAGDASDFPIPEMYRFRNYLIRSFNTDKPYDQFLREQIAGDLLPASNDEDRRDKLVATSYLASSRRFGQSMGEFHLTIDDTIDNLGRVTLGLTLGCARCHDHKFDPVPAKDYYALAGIFQSSNYSHAGLEHNQYLEHLIALDPKDAARLGRAQERMVALHAIVKKGGGPDPNATSDQRLKYLESSVELNQLRESFPTVPAAFGVTDGKPRNAFLLAKGEPDLKGPEVPRGFLSVLGGQQVPADHKGSGRELLASWITNPANPLTARVIVNRVWQWHFGRGLVNTPNDFGKRGDAPSHPELLDYLAARFVEDGWSMKKLHRRILLTRAWQTAAGENATNLGKDPANQFYWRFNRRRLTAEELRDTMLAASGQLDSTPGGPHPFPPRGSYRFTQHRPFVADMAMYDTRRRSVYLVQQRFRRHPYLELFDGPDPNNATAVRGGDPTAPQSLYFMNSDFVHQQGDALAVRVGLAHPDTNGRVNAAYQLLFARPTKPAELSQAARFLAAAQPASGSEEPARAALASLMRVLLASNEFFYVD